MNTITRIHDEYCKSKQLENKVPILVLGTFDSPLMLYPERLFILDGHREENFYILMNDRTDFYDFSEIKSIDWFDSVKNFAVFADQIFFTLDYLDFATFENYVPLCFWELNFLFENDLLYKVTFYKDYERTELTDEQLAFIISCCKTKSFR